MTFFNKLRPLNRTEKNHLAKLESFVGNVKAKEIMDVVKKGMAGIYYASTDTKIIQPISYPQLNALKDEHNLKVYVDDNNRIIRRSAFEKLFSLFSQKAENVFGKALGSGVPPALASAIGLQLFSDEKLHVFVLGQSNHLISNLDTIAPIMEYYDGTGNMAIARKGSSYEHGLLPKAHNGIFLLTDFHVEKKAREHLFHAMKEGFVSVNRQSYSGRFKANVCVLAFSKPKGVKLMKRNIALLKSQFPDPGALDRFHLVFVFDDSVEQVSMPADDARFLRNYVLYARSRSMEWDKQYDGLVDKFMDFIRQDESHFVVDITEKISAGIKRMALARARMHLRELNENDVKEALKVMRDSLYLGS